MTEGILLLLLEWSCGKSESVSFLIFELDLLGGQWALSLLESCCLCGQPNFHCCLWLPQFLFNLNSSKQKVSVFSLTLNVCVSVEAVALLIAFRFPSLKIRPKWELTEKEATRLVSAKASFLFFHLLVHFHHNKTFCWALLKLSFPSSSHFTFTNN